jgi:hypothetical protein
MSRENLTALLLSRSTALTSSKLRIAVILGMFFAYNAMRLEVPYGRTWLGNVNLRRIHC